MLMMKKLLPLLLLAAACSDGVDVSGIWKTFGDSPEQFNEFSEQFTSEGRVQLALGQYGRDVAGTFYLCFEAFGLGDGGGGNSQLEPCIKPDHCRHLFEGQVTDGKLSFYLFIEDEDEKGGRELTGNFVSTTIDGVDALTGWFEDRKDSSFPKIHLQMKRVGEYEDIGKQGLDEGCKE